MLKSILRKIYNRLPVIGELHEIRDRLGHIEYSLKSTRDLKAGQMIKLLDFDLRTHPRYGDEKRLLCYQSQVCSQNSEDGIIHEIFNRIGTTNKIFAEVGIGNGCENNTAFLMSQGWTGSWIDGDSGFLQTLKSRIDITTDCLKYIVSFATRENISSLFEQLDVPAEFDLLSLDIDQNTYYAWEGLGNYRPRVVVIEYNAAIPSDINWKVNYDPNRAWDGSQNFGASLKAFEILGRKLGYSLVGCDFFGVNAFFVRDDLVAGMFAEPFTSENHYEPPRYAISSRRSHPSSILDRESDPQQAQR